MHYQDIFHVDNGTDSVLKMLVHFFYKLGQS